MKVRINRRFHQVLLMSAGVFISSQAWAQESQNPFPDEEGREAIFAVCTHCHGLNYITQIEQTREQWENTVYDMIARGAPLEENDLDAVVQYLVDNFAVDGD